MSLPERPRFGEMSLLHFAPEPELEDRLRPLFGRYETADLTETSKWEAKLCQAIPIKIPAPFTG